MYTYIYICTYNTGMYIHAYVHTWVVSHMLTVGPGLAWTLHRYITHFCACHKTRLITAKRFVRTIRCKVLNRLVLDGTGSGALYTQDTHHTSHTHSHTVTHIKHAHFIAHCQHSAQDLRKPQVIEGSHTEHALPTAAAQLNCFKGTSITSTNVTANTWQGFWDTYIRMQINFLFTFMHSLAKYSGYVYTCANTHTHV